jgi:mRNA interferase YafQ
MENDTPQQKKLSRTSSDKIYEQVYSRPFRKAIKKCSKSGNGQLGLVWEIVKRLSKGEVLDQKYKDHKLSGSMQNLRECHAAPDLLIVYCFDEEAKELRLEYLGNHSELFG